MTSIPSPAFTTSHVPLLTCRQVQALGLPDEWLVDDCLPAEGFAVLYGSAVGKDFLALDWACCVGSGLAWGGRSVLRGPAVYVAAEGRRGLPKRLTVWEREHLRDLSGKVLFPQQPRDGIRIRFDDSGDMETLREGIRRSECRPTLVVLSATGLENVSRLIEECHRMRREMACTVLLVMPGPARRALDESADTVMELMSPDARPERRYFLLLVCRKQRDAAPFAGISLRLMPVVMEDGQSSCVIRAAGPRRTATARSTQDR
jgi:hypothetical protein